MKFKNQRIIKIWNLIIWRGLDRTTLESKAQSFIRFPQAFSEAGAENF
jgi:hypothetical protein